MAELTDLPFEVLNIIITFVVMSCDGARDLVRASATCKVLLTFARQPEVLRLVSFQNEMLLFPCEPHHHIDGLLSRCVRAGNLTAEYFMAKAVLLGRSPLWTMMLANHLQQRSIRCVTDLPLPERRYIAESLKTCSIADLPYILFSSENHPHIRETYGRLHPMRLVRLFISQASGTEILKWHRRLEEFIVWFVGYDMAYESGIIMHLNCLYVLVKVVQLPRTKPWMFRSFKRLLLSRFDGLFLVGPGPM